MCALRRFGQGKAALKHPPNLAATYGLVSLCAASGEAIAFVRSRCNEFAREVSQ